MPPFRPGHEKSLQYIAAVNLANQSIVFDNRISFVSIFYKLFSQVYHVHIEVNGFHMGKALLHNWPVIVGVVTMGDGK